MYRSERRQVERSDFHRPDELGRLGLSDWGCAFVLFLLVPAALLGLVGRIVGAVIAPGVGEKAGLLVGLGVAIVVFVLVMRESHRQRAAQQAFLEAGEVEELTVEQASCHQLDLFNSDPILAIDIGAGALLVLQGQWLQDPAIYGCDPPEGDPVDEHFNGLPAPHAFPADAFRLIRRPDDGGVIRIWPAGSYAEPHDTGQTVELDYTLPQSSIVECGIHDLAERLQARIGIGGGNEASG